MEISSSPFFISQEPCLTNKKSEEKSKQSQAIPEKTHAFFMSFLGLNKGISNGISLLLENAKKILGEMDDFSDTEKAELEKDFDDINQSIECIKTKNKELLLNHYRIALLYRKRFVLPLITPPTMDSPQGHAFPFVITEDKEKSLTLCSILNGKHRARRFSRVLPEVAKRVSATYSFFLPTTQSLWIEKLFLPTFCSKNREFWTPQATYKFFVEGPVEASKNQEEPLAHSRDETWLDSMESAPLAFCHSLLREWMKKNGKEGVYARYIAFEMNNFFKRFYDYLVSLSSYEAEEKELEKILPSIKDTLLFYQDKFNKGEKNNPLSTEELGNWQEITTLLREEISKIEEQKCRMKNHLVSRSSFLLKEEEEATINQPEFVKSPDRELFLRHETILRSNLISHNSADFLPKIKNLKTLMGDGQAILVDKGIMMHTFFSHLPTADDIFWDSIRENEVEDVVVNLINLFDLFSKSYGALYGEERNTTFLPWILVDQLAVYGAVFRLARRIPDLKMKNYCPPPFTFETPEMLYFQLEKDAKRWVELREGLNQWQKACAEKNDGTFWDWITAANRNTQHLFCASRWIGRDPDIVFKDDSYYKDFSKNELPPLYLSLSRCFYQTCYVLNLAHIMSLNWLDFIYKESFKEEFLDSQYRVQITLKSPFSSDTEFTYDKTANVISEQKKYVRTRQNPFRSNLITDTEVVKSLWIHEEERLGRSPKVHPFFLISPFTNKFFEGSWSYDGLISLFEKESDFFDNLSRQQIIEELCLRTDRLMESSEQDPLLIDRLRSSIERQIEQNIVSTHPELLFYWVRLGIHIEHRWALLRGENSINRKQLCKLLSPLDKLEKVFERAKDRNTESPIWKRDFALHKAYLLAVASLSDRHMVARLITEWFTSQQAPPSSRTLSPSWLVFETARLIQEHSAFTPEGREAFSDAMVSGVASYFEKNPDGSSGQKGISCSFKQFPLIECTRGNEKYTFSLWNGRVARE